MAKTRIITAKEAKELYGIDIPDGFEAHVTLLEDREDLINSYDNFSEGAKEAIKEMFLEEEDYETLAKLPKDMSEGGDI